MRGTGATICSQLLVFADCSVSVRMSEQPERKRTRGTHTGSTPRQVGKRSMSPTSGATLKSKFSAAPSANTGVPLMLLSEKDNFFFLFGVPLACFLSDCSLILELTEHLAYGCSMHHVSQCTVYAYHIQLYNIIYRICRSISRTPNSWSIKIISIFAGV